MSHSNFLNQERPYLEHGITQGQTDTTTLAAHDFDVDVRSGFMPPKPPLAMLPESWYLWEHLLHDGIDVQLPLNPNSNSVSQNVCLWHISVEKVRPTFCSYCTCSQP